MLVIIGKATAKSMARKAFNQEIAQGFARDPENIINLIYSREWGVYFYNQGKYFKMQSTKDMLRRIIQFTNENYPDQAHTMHFYEDVLKQLEFYVPRAFDSIKFDYIALEDRLLNANTLEFEDFNVDKIAIHHIPIHTQDMGKPTPNFDYFIKSTLVKKEDDKEPDVELIELLQEMMGYYLMPTLKGEAMFFLTGKGSNGKSVFIQLLTQMIGADYCSAMSIETLTTNRFATASLVGKRLNVCNEEESKYIEVSKFKALVTGDAIQAEIKNGAFFWMVPGTKYLYSTNKIPSFSSIDGGLKRRVKIIPFNRVFREEEKDKEILDKMLPEMAGILAWAIEGGRRLKENNFNFCKPAQFITSLDEFEEEVSAPLRFFKSRYEVVPDREEPSIALPQQQLYNEYITWCQENGRKASNKTNFFKDLRMQIDDFEKAESFTKKDGRTTRSVLVREKTDDDGLVFYDEVKGDVGFDFSEGDEVNLDDIKF